MRAHARRARRTLCEKRHRACGAAVAHSAEGTKKKRAKVRAAACAAAEARTSWGSKTRARCQAAARPCTTQSRMYSATFLLRTLQGPQHARPRARARARAPVCLLLAGTAHGRARTRTLARGYSCTVTNGEVAPWAWLLKGAPSSDRIGLPLHMQLARACQWAEARNAQHARARLAAGRALRGRARPRARARVMPTRARLLCLLGDRGGPAAVVDGIHCQSRGHRAPWYLSAGRNVRGSVLARRCAEQQLHGRRGGLKWTLRGSR